MLRHNISHDLVSLQHGFDPKSTHILNSDLNSVRPSKSTIIPTQSLNYHVDTPRNSEIMEINRANVSWGNNVNFTIPKNEIIDASSVYLRIDIPGFGTGAEIIRSAGGMNAILRYYVRSSSEVIVHMTRKSAIDLHYNLADTNGKNIMQQLNHCGKDLAGRTGVFANPSHLFIPIFMGKLSRNGHNHGIHEEMTEDLFKCPVETTIEFTLCVPDDFYIQGAGNPLVDPNNIQLCYTRYLLTDKSCEVVKERMLTTIEKFNYIQSIELERINLGDTETTIDLTQFNSAACYGLILTFSDVVEWDTNKNFIGLQDPADITEISLRRSGSQFYREEFPKTFNLTVKQKLFGEDVNSNLIFLNFGGKNIWKYLSGQETSAGSINFSPGHSIQLHISSSPWAANVYLTITGLFDSFLSFPNRVTAFKK